MKIQASRAVHEALTVNETQSIASLLLTLPFDCTAFLEPSLHLLELFFTFALQCVFNIMKDTQIYQSVALLKIS
jgi:hypothetical protein